MSITLGSLFDGIGGFPLVAERNGIIPLWASEIERYCALITSIRFPDMLQLGDITQLDGRKLEPVDIITMGSPCQDLSSAGRQEGLVGKRSGLFFEGIRIIREMREVTNGEYPKFIVWENVPGAFHSNQGMDFRAVLEEIGHTEFPMPKNGKWATAGMAELPSCQIVWRVLDSQYFGVLQCRRRIFLVADFRAEGRCGEKILFEQKSLSRDFKSSKEKTQRTTAGTQNSVAYTGWDGYHFGNWRKADKLGALTVGCGRIRNCTPLVSAEILKNSSDNEQHAVAIDIYNGSITGDKTCAVTTAASVSNGTSPKVAYGITKKSEKIFCLGHDARATNFQANKAGTLTATDYKQPPVINQSKIIRRLTPLECERLQGFPDNWTKVNHRLCSDSARYKTIGNSVAIPCVNFVISRIKKYGFGKNQ